MRGYLKLKDYFFRKKWLPFSKMYRNEQRYFGKVFHQRLYRTRFVYFKQKHFNEKSMIQREIRKKKLGPNGKEKKKPTIDCKKTSHVVSGLKEKVKTNCQDPLSRRKRWQIYHRLLAWQMVMDNLESPSNGQFTSANTHQLCRGNCTGLMREPHWYQAFILFYFFPF